MRAPHRFTAPRIGTLAAVAVLALLAAVGIAGAASNGPGTKALGLPSQASLLFTLNAGAGTMRPTDGEGGDQYRLELTGVDGRTVWFADRPRRDAGRLPTERFFGGWGGLGFRDDPPNSALVAKVGHHTRTVAVELKLRHYDRRDRSAVFDTRLLGSLGGGLVHLNRSLGATPAAHFEAPTLFIDNGGSEPGCTLGESRLLPVSPASKAAIDGMIPAEGELLSVERNIPLFTLWGNTYGGNGKTNFAAPKLSSPPGTTRFLCAEGYYPQPETLSPTCNLGETAFWALPHGVAGVSEWAPADGRQIFVPEFQAYGERFAPGERLATLPKVTAPPGLTALTCVASPGGSEPPTILGQLELLPSLAKSQEGRLLPASGTAVPESSPLGALLSADSVLDGKLPNLPSPGPSANWFVSADGSWPLG